MAKKKVVETTENKKGKLVFFSERKDAQGKPVLEMPKEFPVRGWIVKKGDTVKGQSPVEYNSISAIVQAAKEIKRDISENLYFFKAADMAYVEL